MTGPSTDPRGTATTTPKRRGTEAAMLGFAVLITVVAHSIVDLTVTNSLGSEVVTFGLWISALWVAAHLAVRRWAPYADPLMLPGVALLVGLGLTVIHRLDLADHVQVRVVKRRLRVSEPELVRLVGRVGNSIAALSKEATSRQTPVLTLPANVPAPIIETVSQPETRADDHALEAVQV